MSKIITVLIETVIFTALIGTVATSVLGADNVSGTAAVLLGLVTLFVVIGFVVTLMKTMGIKVSGMR